MAVSKKQIKQLLVSASDIALGAGEILKKRFDQQHKVRYKGRIDPVTEADLKSEKFIVSEINKRYPDHAILAEEGGGDDNGSVFRWVIDPLDGTVNYAHGFPVYCVSIAVEHENRIIVGVIYDPERDEIFTAGRGLGSHLNGHRIHVSSERKLQRALLATGFAYNVRTARKNNLGLFARMVKTAQAVRRAGSAALDLCWLACGRLDGFWEFYLHPWDTAAAKLMVEEAGGKVTQVDGKAYSVFHKNILASNARLHSALKKALTGG